MLDEAKVTYPESIEKVLTTVEKIIDCVEEIEKIELYLIKA